MQTDVELTCSKLLFHAAGSQLRIGLLLAEVGFIIREHHGHGDDERVSYVVKDAICFFMSSVISLPKGDFAL
jgi:hypothetical protein